MVKEANQNGKKIDWKKAFTFVVVVVLIVLKLMYGNESGGEDAGGLRGESLVESSQGVELTVTPAPEIPDLAFRSEYLLEQHYEKHGMDMGFTSAEEYEAAACLVIGNPETLHKIEAEDGDDVYYLESTNEFVVVSKDGYIRTYFLPDDGIKYYNRQ